MSIPESFAGLELGGGFEGDSVATSTTGASTTGASTPAGTWHSPEGIELLQGRTGVTLLNERRVVIDVTRPALG